jgi:hypothetical protein
MDYPSTGNGYCRQQALLISDSYHRLLGESLLNVELNSLAKSLFHAPFAILSHTNHQDPIFNYANLKALALFEFSWDELIKLPSRLSAESPQQEERHELLNMVNRNGYLQGYHGIRVSKSGKKFQINDATVWNLTNGAGDFLGQAAMFDSWDYL